MSGIQSLMQGAAPQNARQGMPQGQQGTPMPNDPRMSAAMGLVDDSVEKFNLDPQTEALMLKNQALDLLKAADNVGKMNVPQQDTNIQEQTEQGIVGMLQSLSPGMQQRGQQMQRSQARQMLGGGAPARPPARPPMPQQNMARPPARPPTGGMPTMGASNMNRMADGGIVGYAGPDGSLVQGEPTPTLGAVPPSAVGDEQIKQFAAQYTALQAGLAAATTPEDKAQSQQLMQALIRDMGNQHATVMQYIDSTKGFTTPSSQMARGGIARGGIIGYKKGGKPELDKELLAALPSPVEVPRPSYPSAEDRRAEREKKEAVQTANIANRDEEYNLRVQLAAAGYGREEQDAYIEAQKAKRRRAVGDFNGLGSLRAPEPFRMQGTNNPPEFRMQGMEEATPTVGTPYDPTGTKSAGLLSGAAQDDFVPAVGALATAPVAPQEFTPDALDLLAEKKLKAALNADPNEVATTRGDRLRELTGLDALMARRIESEKAVRDQKESRLSPEETRKRRFQAGLAGLAERGLGGFGAGRTSEMDKIAAERLGIEETSLADLNSLIAEKRAMGMTLFEAENSARAEIQESQDSAAAAAGRRGDTRRTAFEAAQRDQRNIEATATQGGLNRANQLAIAEIQTSGSQFGRSLGIRIKALRDELGSDVSQTEIENQALQSLVDDSLRSDLARLGVQENDQNRKIINDSIEAATKMLTGNIANLTKDPAQLQDEIFTLAEKIRNDLYGSTPSIGPAVGTESGGFRFKGGDPADRNNWQEI